MLVPMAFPKRTGTAFPIILPIVASVTGAPGGTNWYRKGNDWSSAPSRSDNPRCWVGCPNRPFPNPMNCVVIVGDGLFHAIRP